MTEKLAIYKCSICGNIVQVLISGEGELICCGHEMKRLVPQTEDGELGEIHIPVFETEHEGCENGVCTEKKVIRLRKHPMSQEHYIELIEAINKDKTELRLKYFYPETVPEFEITDFRDAEYAVEYCNIHGLWSNKND